MARQPDTNGGQNKHRKQIACQHSGGNHQPWPKRLSASTPLANPIKIKLAVLKTTLKVYLTFILE
ncbi:hypothetical protein AX334_01335 [Salmonella enterica]|nr:hypothetical protein [Salmonella enterica]EAY8672250.1 hypothetical protein [Salmonella enterica]